MPTPPYLREVDGGVELALLVSPRASRTRVSGQREGRLRIGIAAPPVDGEANAELQAFLARALGVPRGAVSLLTGETGRRKRVLVQGIPASRAAEAFEGSP